MGWLTWQTLTWRLCCMTWRWQVRSVYWEQIEVGALPEGLPSVILLQSVDAALDLDQVGLELPNLPSFRLKLPNLQNLVKSYRPELYAALCAAQTCSD